MALRNGSLTMAGLSDYLRLVRFSHSIFALPFALIALLVATDGRPRFELAGLVVLAAVAARTAAMAYNRYVDRHIDGQNPRTRARELPSGRIRPTQALALTAGAALVFLAAAYALSPLCGLLAVPVLLFLLGYSHAKRFTTLCHLWLGIALGLAPPAAWLAARGILDSSLLTPAVLGLGVVLWVQGFDMLYACQDEAFDRAHGLHSVPASYSKTRALRLAALCHGLSVPLFAAFGVLAGLSFAYALAVILTTGLLLAEHRLVRADADLQRINLAFFHLNAIVSVTLLAGTMLDLYLFR